MKNIAMLFPDELYEVMTKARFDEKRNSISEFVREAVKTYLRNTGYELPNEFEVIKRGPEPGWKNSVKEPIAKAVENYVTPSQPSPAWGELKGWNNE